MAYRGLLRVGRAVDSVRVAGMSSGAASGSVHKLPTLAYDYTALEPHISGQIMKIHHQNHHQAYVNNLNAALEKQLAAEKAGNVAEMIQLQQAIRFNGGGHVNHSLFFENLAPAGKPGVGEPTGALKKYIDTHFGSLDEFKKKFNAASVGVQGSGWGWLVFNTETKRPEITTRANQDPVSVVKEHIPLLGIDVWEHAYYLQYQFNRGEYLKNVWNVVNWNAVDARLANCPK